MASKIVRSAKVVMPYKGEDIAGFCTNFVYTSNAYGEADSVSIALQDRDGRIWQGQRWPLRGDELEPVIITENWRKNGDYHELACGIFELDEPEVNGPPDVLTLKGTAWKTRSSAQAEKKNCGWEDVALSEVAGDIAERNGLKLNWQTKKDRDYERLDQKEEADLAFISRLAKEAGNGVLVQKNELKIMDVEALEQQPPSFVFNRLQLFAGGKAAGRYRFWGETHDKYKSCVVTWHNTEKGEFYSGKADDNTVPSGEVLKICDRKVADSGEAEKVATELLAAKNRPSLQAELPLVGETDIVAGLVCELTEFGGFSGRYLIKQAVHSPLDEYTVKVGLQKVRQCV